MQGRIFLNVIFSVLCSGSWNDPIGSVYKIYNIYEKNRYDYPNHQFVLIPPPKTQNPPQLVPLKGQNANYTAGTDVAKLSFVVV